MTNMSGFNARRRAEIDKAKTLLLETLRRNGTMTRDELRAKVGLKVNTFRPAMAELYSEGKIWTVIGDGIEAARETAVLD